CLAMVGHSRFRTSFDLGSIPNKRISGSIDGGVRTPRTPLRIISFNRFDAPRVGDLTSFRGTTMRRACTAPRKTGAGKLDGGEPIQHGELPRPLPSTYFVTAPILPLNSF